MDTRWSGEAKYETLLAVAQAANSQRDLSRVLQAVAGALEGLVSVDGIMVSTPAALARVGVLEIHRSLITMAPRAGSAHHPVAVQAKSPVYLMSTWSGVGGRAPRLPPPRPASPSKGPVLTRPGWRVPFARAQRVLRGTGPLSSRRALSHRLVGWCGDQLPGLQAETGARVPAVPSGGAAPGGAAASLAEALCPPAWPAAAGGRAGAARVPHVRSRFPWLRPALVPDVPDKRALPVLMSRTFCPSWPDPVGGVAARGGAGARSASACRAHHAPPPAGDLPEASGAPARPLPVRRRGRRRVCPRTTRSRAPARCRRLRRHRRRPGPMASPRSPAGRAVRRERGRPRSVPATPGSARPRPPRRCWASRLPR